MTREIEHLSLRFITYLREEFESPEIEYDHPLVKLHGGFETQIFRFRLKGNKGHLSGDLILRLYPAYYGSANAEWESVVLRILADTGYPVPKVRILCSDVSILGGAFFVMDCLPGKPMVYSSMKMMPELLGKIHAELHLINPIIAIDKFIKLGVQEDILYLNNRYDWLISKEKKFPWLKEAIDWLLENRPPEPDRLALCHGDFHPLNILVHDGVVSGVLDWPGFLIADPVLDIANTAVLTTIPFKHIAPSLGMEVSSTDLEKFVADYLNAYLSYNKVDLTLLSYYRVRRCVLALIQGREGQTAWGGQPIIKELTSTIHSTSGVKVVVPE